MPQACSVCTHQQRTAIDRAIVAGVPNRRIASQFGLTEIAVRRHKGRHLSLRLVKAQEARDDRQARSLLDQMDEHLRRARDVLDRVVPKEGRVRALDAAVALREVRETLMAIGRLTGELRSNAQVEVNIVRHPAWIALQDRLLAVLSRFPDARAVVMEMLREDAAGRELESDRPR